MKNNRKTGAMLAGLSFLIAAAPAWADAGFGAGQSLDVNEFLTEARAILAPVAPGMILAGYPSGKREPVKFVPIAGGSFMMGTDDGLSAGVASNAKPVHKVTIEDFEMSRTLVTVEQYRDCVIKGPCTKPNAGGRCNYEKTGREDHPVNCVSWFQAYEYAQFKKARLPTESEWEYAATSGGRKIKYPWGDDAPTCGDRDGGNGNAVVYGNGGYGCGSDGTMPVCSKPGGNTAQGLCDMAGNVWQWVQDKYQSSYANAPIDGKANEVGFHRVLRGGNFYLNNADHLRAAYRVVDLARTQGDDSGFRLARSLR